jgi:hypothetical protein
MFWKIEEESHGWQVNICIHSQAKKTPLNKVKKKTPLNKVKKKTH